jgi:dTDP-4-dehydrorhamnose reductase
MILLLGGSGYVGSAFAAHFAEFNIPFRSVSRSDVNYFNRDSLVNALKESKSTFLVNCAGYTGKPNVDACELHKAECLEGNAVLPAVIRDACDLAGIPWGHVSSGCIYTGSKANQIGFTESDKPNFSFRTNNCSFYSGCKALGEECLDGADNVFLWRLRIPFNHEDSNRNYLSKLLRYERLLEATNSVSHLNEFVSACIQSWTDRIPFGIYNVTNTGFVTTREVVSMIKRHLRLDRSFQFFQDEDQFMTMAAKTPRSNCILDNSKILNAGVRLSHVSDAIEMSLRNWQSQ